MASLGRLGRKYDPIDLDFDWFEATIRVNPSCSRAALVEFIAEAGTVDQADEIRGAQLIMRMLREVIHPDDFEQFWTIAKRERQDPKNDLMPIAQQVIEKTSDFPTGQSSASTSGPASTPPRFEVDLPSQGVPAPTLTGAPDAPRTAADKALRMLRGRPDLQEFVVMQEESERARNGRAVTPV